ncbi:hypothetical protein Q427_31295 [Halomonas sp. BC04]|nr:hypothetical protein [Halomonas sp. BC04]EWG98287.1 hypothetical protein Q427_31295 [Halomonas sp. BC04]
MAKPEQASLLVWYRNNVLHLFALAGLTAFAFRHAPQHDLDSLRHLLEPAWPILARELFLEKDALAGTLPAMLDTLGQAGLLTNEAGAWHRAEELEAGEQLDLLGRLMQPSLERGYLLLAILLDQPPGSQGRDGLTERSRQMAERLALLSGRDAPEFFDRSLFAGLIGSLEAEGWVWEASDRLWFDQRLREAAQRSRALFDAELRHRLQLVTRG